MIDETVEEIQEMQTHSSSTVAVKAAQALEDLLTREFETVEEFERALEHNSNALRRANPSHASLVTTQRAIVTMVTDAENESVEAAKRNTEEAIDSVVEQVVTAKRRAAENAAPLFEDGLTFMTHDYSSTVLEAVEQAVAEGAYLDAYVLEARPRYLGRKTARVLGEIDQVDVTLVVDSASGHYLPECDRVFTGMDCIVDETLYNRVGTFPLVATANEVGVPVTTIASSAKIVGEAFRFENDFRSGSEVIREPAEGFSVANPAYDATPTRLLDSVVTDEGTWEY
ncbi:translation initiation factor eIF-2B [Haladaptatus salinisoli]|uniref:translation initiation factor eIF-2B n=1 Tax=Haladaptatus salinisoli TaxID=2884876 RepID=UPI001D0A5368|nr:translation initiation factor eIF-2B [Haladaptatus salinisoli]